MPIYKNKNDHKLKIGEIVFEANEEKTVDCYLYDDDLEKISNDPPPEVILKSGTFSLMTGEVHNVELVNTAENLLEVVVQAPDGGIKLYHNSTDNQHIEFQGVYQDQLST